MTKKINNLLFCSSFDFLEAKSETDAPTFRMVAYTGGPMKVSAFEQPVIVDLTGLNFKPTIPIRLDHNAEKGVGHTTRIAIEEGRLVAEGVISRENSWSKDVTQSGKRGFPWQASIGGPVLESEYVPEGTSVTVNSETFDGPVYVVRKMELKEISFVDNGADSHTSAIVCASNSQSEENVKMNEDVKKEVIADVPKEEPEKVEAGAGESKDKAEVMADIKKMVNEIKASLTEQIANENNRVNKIHGIGGNKFPELEATAIADNWTAEKFELEYLRKDRPSAPAIHAGSTKQVGDKVLEAVAVRASGMDSGSMEKIYDVPTLEAADHYRGIGLQEFCELACRQQLPRFSRDGSEWLRAAFSTAALPMILSNVANKRLLEGFNYVESAWREIAKISAVNDFKEHTRYRMTGSFTFEKVTPGGELKHGEIGEEKFTQQADTMGIMFALTRKMIIDDDLGALSDIPRQIGMGASEAINDAFWKTFLSNPTQSDGKTFFHANHKNFLDGADTNLSIGALTKAEIKFAEQTKPNGRPLGIQPSVLIVPVALKTTAMTLMNATEVNETTTANTPQVNINPHTGKYKVISSAYMSNSTFTGYSSKAWYLMADRNRMPSFEVAFLGGVDRPTIERADADFDTLGIQFRGYIDFGVKEQDYRAILKVKGET